MLSPEVWNFKAPRHRYELLLKSNHPTDTISSHYFNHSVSVVLPNTTSIPESFNERILEDSDYYRVDGLRAVDLVNKEFIESFVKKGELSLLTVERKIDTENLATITPTGNLLLSITRENYQKLGIEGKPTYFERKQHSRYVVTIDLKDEKLAPGKKYYERIRNSLDRLNDLTFNVILAWDPPEEKLCPSSVAAWFNNHGYSVNICTLQTIRRVEYSLDIPIIEENCNFDEFFEWLGIFSIGGKLTNESKEDEYVSSYKCPSPKVQIGQVQYLQYTGFFTRRKIESIYKTIKDFLKSRDTLPWCSIDIQGFADSPVSWGLKEHNFYIDGDNSFTIVLRSDNDDDCILRKSLSSNNMPKNTQ